MKIRQMIRPMFVIGFLVAIPILGHCATPEWQIIPAESTLTFTGTQNGAPISGAFKSFTAHIAGSPNDLKTCNIDVVIDINSVSLSYAKLRDQLLTPDWFNVKLFPKAEFKSTQVTKIDNNNYQAMGELTIRDKKETVVLKFTATKLSPNKGSFVGSTVIKRTTFGVGQGDWKATDEIKDDVTINFKLVGVIRQ